MLKKEEISWNKCDDNYEEILNIGMYLGALSTWMFSDHVMNNEKLLLKYLDTVFEYWIEYDRIRKENFYAINFTFV